MRPLLALGTLSMFVAVAHADSDAWKKEFMSSMHRMDDAMKQADAADPDVAFAVKMIPHHQGAIDMAHIELKYGKDDEAKREASAVIADNKKSIERLQAFIDKHAKQ